jgi:hypothetical protein
MVSAETSKENIIKLEDKETRTILNAERKDTK